MAEQEDGRVPRRNTRGHPGQNRLYNQLGVKDLRELLDRKRSERGHEPHIPPPDPSYNYLKDPLRENEDNESHEQRPRKYHNKNNPHTNQKTENQPYPRTSRDIENPMNITIEFSTSTGEHVYKMDETTILPTIKHVPDLLPPGATPQNRPFRGRGRGRGRGQPRTYHTRTYRSNNFDKRTTPARVESVLEDKPTPAAPPVVDTQQQQQVLTNPAEENWDEELGENKNHSVDKESDGPCEEEGLEAGLQSLNLAADDTGKAEVEGGVSEENSEETAEEKGE